MKAGFKYSMSVVGFAASWEATKSVIIPTLFWTGGAVGSAEYVHWVVKSHYANIARAGANTAATAAREERDQENASTLMDELVDLVTREDAFVESMRLRSNALPATAATIAGFRQDNAALIKRADHVRAHMPVALAADVATRIAQLKSLDAELQSFVPRSASAL